MKFVGCFSPKNSFFLQTPPSELLHALLHDGWDLLGTRRTLICDGVQQTLAKYTYM